MESRRWGILATLLVSSAFLKKGRETLWRGRGLAHRRRRRLSLAISPWHPCLGKASVRVT